MRIGTIMGTLRPARTAPGFDGVWTQVRVDTENIVAYDPLGAKEGAVVLLAEGDNARRFAQDVLADAVVAAVLEKNGNNG